MLRISSYNEISSIMFFNKGTLKNGLIKEIIEMVIFIKILTDYK